MVKQERINAGYSAGTRASKWLSPSWQICVRVINGFTKYPDFDEPERRFGTRNRVIVRRRRLKVGAKEDGEKKGTQKRNYEATHHRYVSCGGVVANLQRTLVMRHRILDLPSAYQCCFAFVKPSCALGGVIIKYLNEFASTHSSQRFFTKYDHRIHKIYWWWKHKTSKIHSVCISVHVMLLDIQIKL